MEGHAPEELMPRFKKRLAFICLVVLVAGCSKAWFVATRRAAAGLTPQDAITVVVVPSPQRE